ncbi:MAG: phosphatidylserine/phosphatidylglycerophosphate/cardiolipin synthase family protein [Oligoflexales bacterium]|nr:phosphatidylserine/phosphatidylglycerophosphate/cardiolipin synthase family protein [Oligoflexales bacterium]
MNFIARIILPLFLTSITLMCAKSRTDENAQLLQASSYRAPSEKMTSILNAIKNEAEEEHATLPYEEAITFASQVEDPLIRGEAIFELIARWIEEADGEIMMQLFLWYTNHNGHEKIIQAIKNRNSGNKKKLIVYLVINSSVRKSVEPVLKDIANKIKLNSEKIEFRAIDFTSKLNVMHSKVVIKDGKEAFVTGISLDKNFNKDSGNWYDYASVFKGTIANQLRKEFLDTWLEALNGVESVNQATMEQKVAFNNALPENLQIKDFTLTENIRQSGSDIPVFISTRRGSRLPNNNNNNPQNIGFIQAMALAKKNINILTPNLNDDAAKNSIIDALMRGVEVRIHLTKGFNELAEILPGQGGGNQDNILELYARIEASASPEKISNLKVRWMRDEEGKIVVDDNKKRRNCSHAKYMSIDGEIMIVGSANMDTQSWNQSREVNLIVDDVDATSRYDQILFEPIFNR